MNWLVMEPLLLFVLAQGLIAEGVQVVAAGANPVLIARGIEKTTKALVAELKLMSKEVEDSELADVAAVSAGNNHEVVKYDSRSIEQGKPYVSHADCFALPNTFQQQQNSQLAQPTQQPGLHQTRLQMMQPHGPQMMQYQGQQFQQMHHQMPPQVIRPQQFGQVNPQDHSTHVVQPQAPQFTPQNMHCTGYQSNMVTPRPPNSQQIQPNMLPSGQSTPQQNPHNIHNQSVESQQDFKTAMPKVEETEFKSGSQVGFSPSQYQQRSALPGQNNPNVPAEVSSGQVSIAGVNSGQPSTTSIMTKEDLGRATWTFLHTLALSYPEVELLSKVTSLQNIIYFEDDRQEEHAFPEGLSNYTIASFGEFEKLWKESLVEPSLPSSQGSKKKGSQALNRLELPAPAISSGFAVLAKVGPEWNLLSSDAYGSPKDDTSFAFIPHGK
ncbi:hypothetical protein KIW84_032459 [Lathyrus oleraceus]|uniref:Uncharacterized protein n=1 Tax=Pisum sativum TaxID=3888 RepID=A0A9D4XVC2_PEA|nr:hypothetical protein KIW84_032457 [Pisum sativum]KAI5427038.1 hypothetical protein KIW84_032459 [Pisum sativum]